MARIARLVLNTGNSNNGKPHKRPAPEGDTEDDDGLELPVTPDEGAPLIPDDDERVVHVPS